MSTNERLKKKIKLDISEWVMITLSWMVYVGGFFFFSKLDSQWILMALGALPVLVTGWTLGMAFGFGAAVLAIILHLAFYLINAGQDLNQSTTLLQHLVGFAVLTIVGILIGHLRDLQRITRTEIDALRNNNQKLVQLSTFLETVNKETTLLIASQNWIDQISPLIHKIRIAAETDHVFLVQLTGNGIINYSGTVYHSWKIPPPNNSDKITLKQPILSSGIINWIEAEETSFPLRDDVRNMSAKTRELLSCQSSGEYAIFPINTNTSLWGFLGFENNQLGFEWDELEINTFKSAALTLGSTFYKKLIEEHLNLRAKELDSLQKTSSGLSSSSHLESGLQTVLSQIFELTPASDSSVYLYQNQSLEFFLSLGKDRQQTLPFSHPGEQEITKIVAETKQDLFIPDVIEYEGIESGIAKEQGGLISFALKAASEIIGVLNIWFPTTRNYSPEEKTILRLLADQAANAIINIQFVQVEREQRLLADSLRKANLQLSDNLELKQVLESILKQVLTLVSARDTHIFLYDGEDLNFGAVMYHEDVPQGSVPLPEEDSIYYQAVEKAERVVIPDIQAEEKIQATWETGSLISLPLIFHRKVIGVMNVSFFEPGELDEDLLQVLDLLSSQAAIAINNARTFEAEREQRKLAQALQHTGRAIQSSLDLEVVLDQILVQIGLVIKYHSANLMLVEDGYARVVRQHGYKDVTGEEPDDLFHAPFKITRFSTLQIMTETKSPLIIPDTDTEPQWVKTRSTATVRSWAGAPIIDEDQVIGFLSLNNQESHYYHPDHTETLAAFAGQASIALKHARLHKEIHDLAIRDPLTNVFNRRGLDQWGLYEIERAKRFKSPLSAIYFDLDQFKQVNDTYGHDVGDSVLQQVVTCCRKVIRKIDIFSRLGGEEFFILLPETSLLVAIQIAERLRKTISKCEIETSSNPINVTISLGVADLNQNITDLPGLISAADKYMFQAKQSGRNTTAFPSKYT